MKKTIQALGIASLLLFFGSWIQNGSAATEAEWEDSTLSASTLSDESIKVHFHRFLTEGKDNLLSRATLEWLDLPFSETSYKSWYLGLANGYHLFNLRAEANPQLNLIVFDHDGHIRDRKQIVWDTQGGAIDFINGQVLQINIYNQSNINTGIDRINLLIDLNGQFQKLDPVEFIHPDRLHPATSSQIIPRIQLEDFSEKKLQEMTHELLAANGEVFADGSLQSYFEHTKWYVPGPVDEVTQLHPIEAYNLANIELVLIGRSN